MQAISIEDDIVKDYLHLDLPHVGYHDCTQFFYISDACMKHKYCLVFSLPVQSTFSSSNWKPPWDC